ncbi:LysR family transcriptional regulator [Bordetella genomosp. 4]|uniref:LysR family transcriptional regulator n=1 Tax=Bordetella genomosp. 4 TaxID=463044 RepID=UPI001595B595|nr:LysR family transcriptional regulator [Bordetella genomosp. 4]
MALSIDQWRLFVQIADHGSLTKVAIMRGVAQSAISRQLSGMERQCGGRLFHRTGRGVALTESGQQLYPRVLAWLEEADALGNDAARAVDEPAGLVRVGVLSSISHECLSHAYDQVRRLHPHIRLRIRDGVGSAVGEWLDNGDVDIGILMRSGRDNRRREGILFTARHLLVGAPGDPVTRSATVSFACLQGLPLILAGAPSAFRRQMDQMARRMGVTLNIALECDSLQIQKHMVLRNGLYAVLAEHAVTRECTNGELQGALIVKPSLTRSITLAMSEVRPMTLACREVAHILRNSLEKLGQP